MTPTAGVDEPRALPMVHKQLAGNVRGLVWFVTGDLAWKAAIFVVLAAVARTAPVPEANAFVLAQTVFTLLVAGGDLGFRAIGTRMLVLTTDATRMLHLLQRVQARRAMAAALIGLPVAALAIAGLADNRMAAGILAFLTMCWLPYFSVCDWALLALQGFRELTLARLLGAAVLVAATLLGVLFSLGLWAVGLGYALCFLLSGWLTRRTLYRMIDRDFNPAPGTSPDLSLAVVDRELAWRSSLVLAAAFAMNALFHAQEVLLSGWLLGSTTAALFGAAFRIVLTAYTLNWLMVQYLSPRLVRLADAPGTRRQSRRATLALAAVGMVLSLMLAVAGPEICQVLYGDRFELSAAVVRHLAASIVLDALAALFGTILVMRGFGRVSLLSIAVACIASAAVFIVAHAVGVDDLAVPVLAKYAGYLVLLFAQLWFLATTGASIGNSAKSLHDKLL